MLVCRPEDREGVDVSLQYNQDGTWKDIANTKLQTTLTAEEKLYALTDVKVNLEQGFVDRLYKVMEFANQINLEHQSLEHRKNALIELERGCAPWHKLIH